MIKLLFPNKVEPSLLENTKIQYNILAREKRHRSRKNRGIDECSVETSPVIETRKRSTSKNKSKKKSNSRTASKAEGEVRLQVRNRTIDLF